MTKISAKFLMILGIAISFAACSNDDSVKSKNNSINSSDSSMGLKDVPAKVYDPCQMLDIKDIEEIFPGANIKITTHDTVPANPLGMKRCFWDASADDMKFVQLTISSDADAKVMAVDKQFENNRQFIVNAKSISGIGDEAYYGGSGLRAGAGLHVLLKNKGVLLGVQVGLGFGNTDVQKHIEIEKSLAHKVIQRL
ncbi:MAG: hypothetical protein WC253_02275 [Sulfurovaceae bacterium]|nr:hypothetical protein [Sulfurovaceae bacterium]